MKRCRVLELTVSIFIVLCFSGCLYQDSIYYTLGEVHEVHRFDEVAVGQMLSDYIEKTDLREYKSFNRMLEYTYDTINNPNPTEVKEVITDMAFYDISDSYTKTLAETVRSYIINRLDIEDNDLTAQSSRFVYSLKRDLLSL